MSWPRELISRGFRYDIRIQKNNKRENKKSFKGIKISILKIQYLFILIALSILGKEGTSKNGWGHDVYDYAHDKHHI